MPTTASVRSKIRLAKTAVIAQDETTHAETGVYAQVQAPQIPARLNPLSDLIDDETYSLLAQHSLIDEKSLRNYHIRKSYLEMRKQRISCADAIDQLQQLHPYLQYDTIRKIIYQVSKAS